MYGTVESNFRPASEADLATLVELGHDFYREEGYPYDEKIARAALLRLLREPERGRIWVAIRADQLIGYLILTFGYSIEFHGVDAIIDEVYVRSEFRGSGLGAEAIALAETTCVELGIDALHLEVERGKNRTQGFYRRCGFRDHNRYLMTKLLR